STMMTVFEFNVPATANYDLRVDAGVSPFGSTIWSWDLHLPGASSSWRREIDRAATFAADNAPHTVTLSPGWHAVVTYRGSGPDTAGAVAATFTATLSALQTPSVSGISPASAAANSGAFTLTVDGSGFLATSEVRWNGSALPTTFV